MYDAEIYRTVADLRRQALLANLEPYAVQAPMKLLMPGFRIFGLDVEYAPVERLTVLARRAGAGEPTAFNAPTTSSPSPR